MNTTFPQDESLPDDNAKLKQISSVFSMVPLLLEIIGSMPTSQDGASPNSQDRKEKLLAINSRIGKHIEVIHTITNGGNGEAYTTQELWAVIDDARAAYQIYWAIKNDPAFVTVMSESRLQEMKVDTAALQCEMNELAKELI